MRVIINGTIEDTCVSLTDEMQEIFHSIKGRNIFIAVSGGNTSKYLFDVWARLYRHKIDWKRVQLFWVDERCVKPTDRESNYHTAATHLLSKVPIMETHIHRIHGEANPFEEAFRYAAIIRKILPWKEDVPVFDLIILGVGEDGHIASLFPDQLCDNVINEDSSGIIDVKNKKCDVFSDDKAESDMDGLDVTIIKVSLKRDINQFRVTMTLPLINRSRNIFMLVTGRGKTEIVKDILCENGNYLRSPVSRIDPIDGKVSMFIDRDTLFFCNSR